MKRAKHVLSLLIVITIVLTLVACGKSSPQPTTTASGGTITQTTGSTGTSAAKSNEIVMPDVELKNKVIKVFHINDTLDDWRSNTQYPGVVELMEKEYGALFEVVPFADYSKAEEKIMALYMSDDMPDLNLFANFPSDLANNFVQPLDDYVDLSSALWDHVRMEMETLKWNGKNYFSVRYPLMATDWFFFNPQIFEANNVKSPLDYYNEGNWYWDTVLELARQLTQDFDGDGQIDQWGLGWAGSAGMILHSQTGVPLVEINANGTVKQNLRNPKIAEAANFFRSLGPAEHNVMLCYSMEVSQDEITQQFGAGKIAMYVAGWFNGGTPAVINNWKKGTVDIAPIPRWKGEATNYRCAQFGTIGICSKAKNPEGAALFIEIDHYTYSDEYAEKYMPGVDPKENEYFSDVWGVNDRQMELIYELFSDWKSPAIPFLSWTFWGWDDGFLSVLSRPWSQILEELEPMAEAGINNWMGKLSQIK